MAEKTEKATPKKLKDARKKGQVAKVQDFPSALTFMVSMGATISAMGFFYAKIGSFTLMMLREVPNLGDDFTNKAGSYFSAALYTILGSSLPIMVLVCFVGVLVNFLIIGPVFSFEAMKFNLKKLNPIEGIKQNSRERLWSSCLNRLQKSLTPP